MSDPTTQDGSSSDPRTSPFAEHVADGFAAARAALSQPMEAPRAVLTPSNAAGRGGPRDADRSDVHGIGDIIIAEGSDVRSSISTDGAAFIGRGVHLRGDAHAAMGAQVGEGVRIDGELSVAGTLRWGAGARAGRVKVDGAFVTDDGVVRTPRLRARRGIEVGDGDGQGGG